MKLFFIRYSKMAFTWLRLHIVFNLINGLLMNLVYQTKFSAWASRNKGKNNDFPSKWDYHKRYDFYKWVLETENLLDAPISYMEFGVASGQSMQWFTGKNQNKESRFHGFDTFTGLPEDFGPYKKGYFNTNNKVPEINDSRITFYQGLFQQTVPGFLATFSNNRRNVIMMDADLYSATLYVLTSLAPLLKKGDIIFFDEFAVPTHEFKAFHDFVQSYYIQLELLGAANNYYFVAFRVN